MKLRKISFFILLFLIACNSLENKLEGGWVIDKAYINNKKVIWDLYTNSLNLKNDNKCTLPYDKWEHKNTAKQKGSWKAFNKNDTLYLKITTKNKYFNRTFRIKNLRKVRDSVSLGLLMKMTLVSDSLKLKCTKAIYK